MRRLALLVPVLLLCLAGPALAGAPLHHRGVAQRLDATLAKVRAQVGKPGVEAVLVRNGRVLWSAERGTAVLQPKRPVRRATLFALGSFGKLVLASFALDRAEAGALDLEAPISKYVGDSVPGATVVTSRELLAHTAGYPDVYSSPEVGPLFGDQYDPNRGWSFATLLAGIHEPVVPGARWEYSNTGYIVLARVLEAVTKQPLARAFARFARPAGVTKRDLTLSRSSAALSRFAHGYVDDGSTSIDSFAGAAGIPTDLYGLPFGDGGFAGTARAAARFLDGLLARERLLRSATVRRMIEPSPQSLAAGAIGEMQGYGLGTATYRAAGHVWRGHDGTYAGFTTMGATDMRRGVSIAVVTNRQLQARQPAIVLWRALAEAYADATRAHRQLG